MQTAISTRTAEPYFRDTPGWYLGVSAYWFAVSFKWFILFLLLPVQVAAVVPGGQKNSWWGLVVLIGAAEAMVGPAIFGYFSDRCTSAWGRRRPFIAIGAALTALAALFLGRADRLWMLVVGYLFLQISDDTATGPYAALVPDLVPEERRGKASGVLSLLQLGAQVVAVGVGLWLARSVLLIYAAIAVINLVCAAIVLWTIREPRLTRRREAAEGERLPESAGTPLSVRVHRWGETWLAPWRSADFRWVWLTRFLNSLGFYTILLYLTNYLTDRMHSLTLGGIRLEGAVQGSMVIALIISLAGGVSAPAAGILADRIGRKRVVYLAGVLMFLTLVPFSLVPVYWVIALLAIPFGVGYGAYLSAAWALASDILPCKEDTAKDMGIWQMSVATPQVLAGLIGSLVDFGNRFEMGRGYSLAFLFASFAFLAGALLVVKVKGST